VTREPLSRAHFAKTNAGPIGREPHVSGLPSQKPSFWAGIHVQGQVWRREDLFGPHLSGGPKRHKLPTTAEGLKNGKGNRTGRLREAAEILEGLVGAQKIRGVPDLPGVPHSGVRNR
jgi:hypothetical protein